MAEEEAIGKDIKWNKKLEEYFAATGEKAHCFAWLHKQAETAFSRKSVFIDLPVIILSTLNGAISVGSSSLFQGSEFSSVGVGCVALLTAILSTIGSYFSFSRRAEGHRIAALNYSKLYRFLSIEMSLPRDERMRPADLLKHVKVEYDRLSEISPLIPPSVIDLFRKRFAGVKDITTPEECNGLHAITIFEGDTQPKPMEPSVATSPKVFQIELPVLKKPVVESRNVETTTGEDGDDAHS